MNSPPRSCRETFRRCRLFAVGVLTAEFVVGLAGTLTPRGEIFPFASWFLFSLRPDRVVSFDLLLRGTERHPIEPPKPFNQGGGLVKSPHSVTVYQLTQQLGRAIEGGQSAQISRLRREIEAQFSAPGMRYEVVRLSYGLADRWKGQPPERSEPLASFVDGKGEAP